MNESKCLKSSKENPSNRSKRRSLSSIQPISTDNKVMTRSMASTKISDKDKVKDKNQRITKWMTQKDSIDSDLKYWKTLAKERQKALEITLNENKQLSEDNQRLTQELEECKLDNELLVQENQHLSRLAEEGVKLKQLLDECIDE